MIVTLIVFLGWIVSVCLHEFGHAIIAYWGGDKTVKDKGYLTLNPLKYTDVSLSLVLPIVFLLIGGIPLPGGAVYINRSLIRNRLWDSAMSAAGPAATFIVALVLAVPFRLGNPLETVETSLSLGTFELEALTTQDQLWLALAFLGLLEVAGAVLNLLPIPSLDGFGIIEPWLPPSVQKQARKYSRYGFLILFVLLWFVPVANATFWGFVDGLTQQIGIPVLFSKVGYAVFQQWSWLPLVILVATIAIGQRLNPRTHVQSNQRVDLQRAIANSEQAVQANPDQPQYWYQRGQLLLEDHQYEAAEAAFHQAIQLKPDADTWHSRGIALLFMQQYEHAIAAFDETLHLQSDQSLAWVHRGRAQRGLQRYEDEIADYEQALALDPEDANIWCDHGLAHYHLGQYKAAVDSFDRAAYIDPSSWTAWYLKGLALMPQQQYKRAIRCYDHALNLRADATQTWIAKGSALLQLQDFEGAIASYDQALSLDSKNATAVYNKACTYSLQGQCEQALDMLSQALNLDPKVGDLAASDADLDPLRSEPAFQQLMAGYHSNSDGAMISG
ncbi:tetratricopeptide repeat protein [Acaryochloris sp. CCMEE 5410]|uniref:tetratricopeptide repeat protein n=1 Tax=Acaryochloris sp. CCMEE 5410 TaxID=310037 RepID=UPI0002484F7B|nr:tetratricopeptide repeat protein [Acaryochloris sp. CCMEE 5410]KAI9130537.1 tetratricopeptide repeat protein [Acaryochloris sp. CCMEE 5410]